MVVRGAGVPSGRAVEHDAAGFHAIDIGDEAVVVPGPQGQARQLLEIGLGNLERNPDVTARIDAVHGVLKIDLKERLIPRAAFESDASAAGDPAGIVEIRSPSPGVRDRSCGNQHPLGRLFGDQGHFDARAAGRARNARVASVGRVPDFAGRAHGDRIGLLDRAAVPRHTVYAELRCIGSRVEPSDAELIDHNLRAGREIRFEQVTVHLRPPVDLRVGPVRPVRPLVPPPRRLGDDRQVDLQRAGPAQGHRVLRRHRSIVEEMPVRVIGKPHEVLRVRHQLLMQPLRIEVRSRLAGPHRRRTVVVQAA